MAKRNVELIEKAGLDVSEVKKSLESGYPRQRAGNYTRLKALPP